MTRGPLDTLTRGLAHVQDATGREHPETHTIQFGGSLSSFYDQANDRIVVVASEAPQQPTTTWNLVSGAITATDMLVGCRAISVGGEAIVHIVASVSPMAAGEVILVDLTTAVVLATVPVLVAFPTPLSSPVVLSPGALVGVRARVTTLAKNDRCFVYNVSIEVPNA